MPAAWGRSLGATEPLAMTEGRNPVTEALHISAVRVPITDMEEFLRLYFDDEDPDAPAEEQAP